MGGTNGEGGGYLLDVVRRLPVLSELRDGSRSRGELADAVGASRTTIHRATTTLEEHGLVERRNGTYRLTAIGEGVAEAACAFRDRAASTQRLAPLFDAVADAPVELDPELFADATVTVAEPGDPYGPIRRFTTLVREATELRWFDTSAVALTNHDEIADCLVDDVVGRVILERADAERLRGDDREGAGALLDAEGLELSVHGNLPFGLMVTGERVGVGGYCADTGALRVYVDTEDAEAVSWGGELFQHYAGAAEPLAEVPVATG